MTTATELSLPVGEALAAVRRVLPFAGTNLSAREPMRYVAWSLAEGKSTLMASDGYAVALVGAGTEPVELRSPPYHRISTGDMEKLKKALRAAPKESSVEISFDEKKVDFTLDGEHFFRAWLGDYQFPDPNFVWPKSQNKRLVVKRTALKAAVIGVCKGQGRVNRHVELSMSKSGTSSCLVLSAKGQEDRELRCDYEGESFVIRLHPKYLKPAIAGFSCQHLELTFEKPRSAVLLQGVEDRSACFLIMPMERW